MKNKLYNFTKSLKWRTRNLVFSIITTLKALPKCVQITLHTLQYIRMIKVSAFNRNIQPTSVGPFFFLSLFYTKNYRIFLYFLPRHYCLLNFVFLHFILLLLLNYQYFFLSLCLYPNPFFFLHLAEKISHDQPGP